VANQATQQSPGYGIAPTGYRLPDDSRLGPVRLQVADLARSLDYYQRVLGLRQASHGEGSATLVPHGEDRPLIVLRERPGAVPVPARGRLGLFHFAVLLPTRADLGRFLRHLAEVGERPGASDHYVSEALYLRDPDGLGIEVYADRPRSLWQANGRELRIGTVAMDAESVLKAGEGEPWRGMPAGTTIGHVHLHVGDLDRAASFYHDGLGLDRMTWSYPGALFLGAGGYHHHLGLNTWAAGAPPAGDGDARLLEWTVELPNADGVVAASRSLEGNGFAVERTPTGQAVAEDPWGTRLRLRVAGTTDEGG
jgi:catechol 2,3-dioxygenase